MSRRFVRGRSGKHKPGKMNKTEEEYYDVLSAKFLAGEILDFKFERLTLKLAEDTRYTADFLVVNKALELELHEVKGFWQDTALVKVKVAAEQFPWFHFIAIRRVTEKRPKGFKRKKGVRAPVTWERREF